MEFNPYTLIGLACTTALYAAYLEARQRRRGREEHLTWITVVVGVALVGEAVAVALLAFAQPNGTPFDVAWWAWRQMLYHFIAGGIPIVAWQIWQDRRHILEALEYERLR